MKLKDRLSAYFDKHPYLKTIFYDRSNKMVFLTALKILVDLAQFVIQLVAFILAPSYWYGTLAALYLIYILTKLSIVLTRTKDTANLDHQNLVYRNTGILLSATILPFSGCIVLIYMTSATFSYPGLMIFTNAFWAFFRIVTAIVYFVKDRKADYYLKSVRNVNVVTALISIMTLQIALINAYWGEDKPTYFNAITGGVISAIMLAIGLFMVIKGDMMRRTKGQNSD